MIWAASAPADAWLWLRFSRGWRMKAMAMAIRAPAGSTPKVQPLIVRITHWINAAAIFIMIGSGWRIFNDHPLFNYIFPPEVTLGGDVGLSQQLWQDSGMGGAL